MNKSNMKRALIILILAGLAGCAATQPPWESAEMGSSVASMIEGQIQDPGAAAGPAENASEGSDGAKTAAVVDAWRKSLAAPKESAGNVVINVGN